MRGLPCWHALSVCTTFAFLRSETCTACWHEHRVCQTVVLELLHLPEQPELAGSNDLQLLQLRVRFRGCRIAACHLALLPSSSCEHVWSWTGHSGGCQAATTGR